MRLTRVPFFLTLFTSGVLCQLSSTEDICPGGDVIFTCVSTINTVAWRVRPAVGDFSSCTVFHDAPSVIDTCGPMDEFTATVSGDNMTSTLSAQSVPDDLNGTIVECDVGDVDKKICIVDGVLVPPQLLHASFSVPGYDGCVVTVEWSEPVISCGGSVSQYVLSVTPPTPDGSGDSKFSTNETQFNLNVSVDVTYTLTVGANDRCGNSRTGQPMDITPKRVTTTCEYSYMYMYSISGLEIEGINITWTTESIDVLNAEADYRVVIIPGSGEGSGYEMVFNDPLMFNCTGDSCSYTFSSDGITDSCSVAVEVVGCVITRTECTNTSSFCDPEDLLVDLPDSGTWSNLTFGETGYSFFIGGNVTFDGVIEGSTATYTTHGDYLVDCEQSYQTTCRNDSWIPLPNITANCSVSDLLPVSIIGNCSNGLCVEFNGTCVGDIATYFTTSDYCIISTSGLTRECQNDRMWSENVPDPLKVCDDRKLLVVHIILLVIGVIVYIIGVAVYLGVVLFQKASSCIVFIKIWYRILIVVSVIISILSLIVWLIMIIYISTNDFCDQGDGYTRGGNSVCKRPSGDNATRTGLVVGSLLSSVLVLVVWITLVILQRWGVVSEFNKPPPKPQRSTNRDMSWEGEEKQELKEVVSEPTTPPLSTDDDKPNPDDDSYDTGGVSSSKSPTSSGSDGTKPKEAVPKSDSKPKKSGSKPKKSGSKSKKSAPKPKEPDPDGEDAQYDVVVKPSHPEPETEEAKEKLKEKRADGVHYGKLDHGVTVRPHAASVSSAPPVPSPTDHEEYSRLRGHQPGQTYGKISRVADSGPEYGKLDASQVAKPGATGDMYDVVHSDQPRHIPRPREEQTQPMPGVPGDLYTEVRNEPLRVPPGQHKGPYESGH